MISFKFIRRYSGYRSYQRIKKIKFKQSLERISKNNCPTKRTYPDKKASSKSAQNRCYSPDGKDVSITRV